MRQVGGGGGGMSGEEDVGGAGRGITSTTSFSLIPSPPPHLPPFPVSSSPMCSQHNSME